MPRTSAVNYYLKPKDEAGKSLIFLQFKYAKHRLVFSFGQKVKPTDWDESKQRVKDKRATTDSGDHLLNDLLDSLEKVCLRTYKSQGEGIPMPDTIKKALKDYLNKNQVADENNKGLYELIDRFIAGEIKHKGKDKSKGSLHNYKAVKKHLKDFEQKHKYPVTFDSVTLDFFYKYTSFLKNEVRLSVNTIAKDIRLLKVFLSEALDLGLNKNIQFKHKKFTYSEEETEAVYLTEREIIDLYRYDLSKNKKLEKVRDLFVFGAFVGLRFSDYSAIKPENIVSIDNEFYIKMLTKKTKEMVIIPCNPIVLDIFKKYSGNTNRLPASISNQKFNGYIKEVMEVAGFDQTGRLTRDASKPLYECVSSHTARRSFATNLYLDGFPTLDLMKITGHKSEKAFLKYIRVSKLDTAKRLSAHIKKDWSTKILHAVA